MNVRLKEVAVVPFTVRDAARRPTGLFSSITIPLQKPPLHACSYFALWETFSLATVANLSTSERSVPIPPLQLNMCTALLLHPAHLIIRVLWGMSGCIHPATARPVSSLYSLIGLHYEGMCRENKAQVKVFSLVCTFHAALLDKECLQS